MEQGRTTNIVLVGVGNSFRRDDGIGIAIARRLRDRLQTPASMVNGNITVHESSGEGADLMSQWENADCVYLFDAVMSGMANTRPGSIHRLEAAKQNIPSDFFKYSSHAFSLAEAVELARALDRLPEELIVYGVEANEFGYGEGLTADVDTAGDKIVERVLEELESIHENRPS